MAFVTDDGEQFDYSSPVLTVSTVQGLLMVEWCEQEIGKLNSLWSMYYNLGRVQWWFKNQDDCVRFTLTWC